MASRLFLMYNIKYSRIIIPFHISIYLLYLHNYMNQSVTKLGLEPLSAAWYFIVIKFIKLYRIIIFTDCAFEILLITLLLV